MSPSPAHEIRADLLRAMGILAGYSSPSKLADGLLPDVVQLDWRLGRMLVGDAKDTETAGGWSTRARLRRYCEAAKFWHAAGIEVTIAVCHGRPSECDRWEQLLNDLVCGVDMRCKSGGSIVLDRSAALSWVRVALAEAPPVPARSRRQRETLRNQ